ncbi:dipeptidase PepE [Bacteroidota bacterium]
MRLLLLSNSTNPGEEYLHYPLGNIKSFLNEFRETIFIPFAAVSIGYDEYYRKVQERFNEINIKVHNLADSSDFEHDIRVSDAIVVGGGNTFKLLKLLQENNLLGLIRERVVNDKVPYIGWSAGSNLTCPTISTTNDMPIVEPYDFKGLGLVPFQINPHYYSVKLDDHGGETRDDRIQEFLIENKNIYMVGLPEGTMLKVENKEISLIGNKKASIFKFGKPVEEYAAGDNLNFLLK